MLQTLFWGSLAQAPTVEANLRGKLHGVVIPFGVGTSGVGTFHLQNTEIGVEDVLDHLPMARQTDGMSWATDGPKK